MPGYERNTHSGLYMDAASKEQKAAEQKAAMDREAWEEEHEMKEEGGSEEHEE